MISFKKHDTGIALVIFTLAMLFFALSRAEAQGWVPGNTPTYNGIPVQGECIVFVENYANQVLGEPMTGIDRYYPFNNHFSDPQAYYSDGAHWVWDDARLQPVGSQRIVNTGSNYPQKDDIIIWSSALPGSRNYGHAAIVYAASSKTNVQVVDSNWSGDKKGQLHTLPNLSYVQGWFRKTGNGPVPGNLPMAVPEVGYNSDHRMVVGMRGINGHIYTIEQTSPGGSFGSFEDHSGNMVGNPIFGHDFLGRVELVIRGADNQVWNLWETSVNGPWTGVPTSFSGTRIAGDPTVASNQDGRMEFWWVDPSGHPQTIYQNSDQNWHAQVTLPGVLSPMLGVEQNADGRLELIGRGTDSAFYDTYQTVINGGFSNWMGLGGAMIGKPVIVRDLSGRLEIFALCGDGTIWYLFQVSPGGSYGGWRQIPHSSGLQSNPAVATMNGLLTVFVRGGDNNLYYTSETSLGNWSGWTGMNCNVSSDPAVGYNSDGKIYVFARGNDGNLYATRQVGSGWATWSLLGGGGSLF